MITPFLVSRSKILELSQYLFFFFRSLLSATCVFVSMVEVVGQEDVMVGIAAVVVAAVEVVVEEKVQVEVLDLEGMEDLVVELVGVALEEVE